VAEWSHHENLLIICKFILCCITVTTTQPFIATTVGLLPDRQSVVRETVACCFNVNLRITYGKRMSEPAPPSGSGGAQTTSSSHSPMTGDSRNQSRGTQRSQKKLVPVRTVKFEGKCDELKGYIYNCADSQQANLGEGSISSSATRAWCSLWLLASAPIGECWLW